MPTLRHPSSADLRPAPATSGSGRLRKLSEHGLQLYPGQSGPAARTRRDKRCPGRPVLHPHGQEQNRHRPLALVAACRHARARGDRHPARLYGNPPSPCHARRQRQRHRGPCFLAPARRRSLLVDSQLLRGRPQRSSRLWFRALRRGVPRTSSSCSSSRGENPPTHLASGISHIIVPLAAFWTAKVLLGYLRFCWFLIISLAFAALILGSVAWRSERNPARRARARAAVRTSRFAFALPCTSFCLITLAIWASLIHLSSGISSNPLFPEAVINAPFPHPTIFNGAHLHLTWIHNAWQSFSHHTYAQGDDLNVANQPQITPAKFIPAALAWSVGYQLPVSLTLIAFAGFLLTWWALPSALTERFPYRNDAKDGQHSGKAPREPTTPPLSIWALGFPVDLTLPR